MPSPVARFTRSPVRMLARAALACLAGLACLAASLVLCASPSTGAAADPRPAARDASAIRARIVFDKDARHPFRSRVRWRAWRRGPAGHWHLVDHASWRAGSGYGGPHGTDECVRNRGWLPNGHYSFIQYDDYWGHLIKGRAFFLGDKRCRNGTRRSDLFLHTETGAHNRQCADRPGDQVCRWEYPRINDYRSYGCIKMAPGDMLALTRHYHRWFRPGVRYAMSRVQVVVHR